MAPVKSYMTHKQNIRPNVLLARGDSRNIFADALRLYLINSPVVRGENLRFREEGVDRILKEVMLPWFNGFRMLMSSISLYETVSLASRFVESQLKSSLCRRQKPISRTTPHRRQTLWIAGSSHLQTVWWHTCAKR